METKSFIALLFLVSINSVLSYEVNHEGYLNQDSALSSEFQSKFAKIISLGFVDRILKRSTQEYGIKVPVLPELPDPLDLIDTSIVDIPMEGINAEIYFCNSSIVGLSKLTDDLRVNQESSAMRIIYELNTEALTTAGLQTTSLNISDLAFDFKSGFGEYKLSLINGFVKLELLVELNIVTQQVHVNATSIGLGFESIALHFDEAIYNDKPVEWDSVNRDIKLLFDQYWPPIKDNLEPVLSMLLDSLFKDCKTNDIIGLDFSCLGLGSGADPDILLVQELKTVLRITDADACPAQFMTSTTESSPTTTESSQTTTESSPTTTESSPTTTESSPTTPDSASTPEQELTSTPDSGSARLDLNATLFFGILLLLVYHKL